MSQGFRPSVSTAQFSPSSSGLPPSSTFGTQSSTISDSTFTHGSSSSGLHIPPPSTSSVTDAEDVPVPPAPRAPIPQSADEVYLRRLALSQARQAPEPIKAPIIPTPAVVPLLAFVPPVSPPALAYNPFAPPASVPPPPSALPPSLSDEKVRSSREAAAAIAARLKALAPPPGAEVGESSTGPSVQEPSSKKYVAPYINI